MTGQELRKVYLDFFRDKDSLVLPSASLIPTDPTTLLTSAGMQPLVPYFKGEETPPASRLASCQKCCRADDLDQVGVTWRHASFFEMLGNFSFGDYFKREAIIWAWEFLTKTLEIDPKLLSVSVYETDDEAEAIWKNDIGLAAERIYRFGKKDNWWGPVGASGPCGPDSEIFYDRGAKYNTGDPELDRPGGDGDRYGELWNLVFQQFNQTEAGELKPLPAPGIDTGMGLERTAAVLQGLDTIHHTDLFAPIINAIPQCRRDGELQVEYSRPELNPQDPTTKPLKVVADHIRAATFLAAEGTTPGNTGRDYMLRRFIRRAYLQGRQLELREPFLYRIVPVVTEMFAATYPEVAARGEVIQDMVRREEERFGGTIEAGVNRLDNLIEDLQKQGAGVLPGAEVFRLYETFGFPREMTEEIAVENGLTIDGEGYQAAAAQHSKISGSGVGVYEKRDFDATDTEFSGYENLSAQATITALRREENGATRVVLDRTPFYAESGGQVGDNGELAADGFRGRVLDTQKQGKTWIHEVEVLEGEPKEGLTVQATVDAPRRRAIMRAHTATHLLHAALRQHLGEHVEQRGSLVEADRLRFDFVQPEPIAPEKLREIEDTVNGWIWDATPVEITSMSLAEAKAQGAMALFGEKYGEVVRTVRVGDTSLELCGGTHLENSAAAGVCRLVSEGGVGANLRRIEALTGEAALRYDRAQEDSLRAAAGVLGAQPDNVPGAAEKLKARVRDLEKQLQSAQQKLAGSAADELLQDAKEINGIPLAAARAPQGLDANALRVLADRLADKLNGVVVLAGESEGKVLWAVKAAKVAIERGAHAGNIARELAQTTGGGGGGRPDFAQAGGKDVSKIGAALQQAEEVLAGQLTP